MSVVIPVFNGARFLREALESVFVQRYEPLEVVVADDGSTDESAAIAESFSGVRCLRLEHGGVSIARNVAIRAARGEWLAFLDADDRWLPGKLEAQMESVVAEPAADIVFTHRVYLMDGPVPRWYRGPVERVVEPCYEPSSWLVRRSAFERVGYFDEGRRLGEDTEWMVRARDHGLREVVHPGLFVERRIHGGNISGTVPNQGKVVLDILRESLGRKRQTGEPPS